MTNNSIKTIPFFSLLAFSASAWTTSMALAQSTPEPNRAPASTTVGATFFKEAPKEENAIDWHAFYIGDVVSNFSGGNKTGSSYLGNFGAKVLLDMEKIAGWQGLKINLYGLGTHGAHPSEYVGDAQGINNIEAPVETAKLYEAWVQKEWNDSHASVLLGLYDLNSEFYVTESAGIFLNASLGIGKDLSQTGLNGPSIFPTTAPALRAKIESVGDTGFYLQAAMIDAVAGRIDHPYGTQVDFNSNEGYLLINEFGLQSREEAEAGAKYKYAVGFWTYTKTFEHLEQTDANGDPLPATSDGGYLLFARDLCPMLNLFARYGWASPEANRFDSNLSAGVTLTGLLPSRQDDELGLAVSHVTNGSPFKDAAANAGQSLSGDETTYELTYQAKFTEEIFVQPDLQYVQNPNSDPSISDALVGTLRVRLDF